MAILSYSRRPPCKDYLGLKSVITRTLIGGVLGVVLHYGVSNANCVLCEIVQGVSVREAINDVTRAQKENPIDGYGYGINLGPYAPKKALSSMGVIGRNIPYLGLFGALAAQVAGMAIPLIPQIRQGFRILGSRKPREVDVS